nr:AraC family transcriptional regulator [Myxococcales bacterium]
MDAASDLRVVIALCTLTKLLDVAGPLQIFTDAGRWSPGYEVVLVSEHGGPTATDTVLSVQSHPWSQIEVRPTDIVVVPGGKGAERDRALNAGLIAWLREVGNRVRTVASTCTGAFLLAEAGLLDGRRAVTHWDDCHKLRAEFPAVQVEDDPIYVADGPMWTSAGVTAGMDLALALVERDHGRRVALRIARNLVMQAKR